MHFLYAIAAVTAVTVSLEQKAKEHKADTSAQYPAFEGTDTDALYGQAAGVDELHGAVRDVHERLGELLATPRESGAVLHPDSPLDHHDRFAELLRGLGVKKETRDALAASHAPDDEEPTKIEEPSAEAKAKKKVIGAMEKKAMSQMGNSLKMMVMLHVMMQPLEKKLRASLEKMPPQSQQKTKDILSHVEKIDALSLTALALVNDVKKAAHGTKHEKAAAIVKLMVGLGEIEKGVKSNLDAMKQEAGAMKASPKAGPPMTNRLHALLHKMEAKVAAELKDPKHKNDPLVAIDVQMLQTMKAAVKKSEALVLVAALAMKKAKTDDERAKIKMAVSDAMKKVMGKLKQDVEALKQHAMVAAATSAAVNVHDRKHEKPKEHEDVPAAPTDGEDKADEARAGADEGSASSYPEDGDKWIFEHPKEKKKSQKVDEEAPKDDEPQAAPSKADSDLDEDTTPKDDEPQAAPSKADSDLDEATTPKDNEPQAAPSKADSDPDEDAPKADADTTDDPAMKTFKHGQNSFMKKLEEDLANLKKKFPKLPKMPPAPPAAEKKESEHVHDGPIFEDNGYMSKLEDDLKKWREQGHAERRAIEEPLAKIDAAVGADGQLGKLRKSFAAKMAQFREEHDAVAEETSPFLPSSELETAAHPMDGVAELKAVAEKLGRLAKHDEPHLRSVQ